MIIYVNLLAGHTELQIACRDGLSSFVNLMLATEYHSNLAAVDEINRCKESQRLEIFLCFCRAGYMNNEQLDRLLNQYLSQNDVRHLSQICEIITTINPYYWHNVNSIDCREDIEESSIMKTLRPYKLHICKLETLCVAAVRKHLSSCNSGKPILLNVESVRKVLPNRFANHLNCNRLFKDETLEDVIRQINNGSGKSSSVIED